MDQRPAIRDSALLPLLEQLFEGVALVRPRPWRVVYANRALCTWLGNTADELREQPLEGVLRVAPLSLLLESMESVWRGERTEASLAADLLRRDCVAKPVEARLVRIVLAQEPFLAVLLRDDMSRGEQIDSAADRRDPLTGLPDRAFLLSRLNALLNSDRAADRQFAVLFVDLDDFKQVNDAHGHLVGDRVLREAARRLNECVREADCVARFGGDEFVVLIQRVADSDEIQRVVSRLHAALVKPISLPDGEVQLSVSVGAATASPEHRSPEKLLAAADRAMYASKRLRS